jgi:hypothetical protein
MTTGGVERLDQMLVVPLSPATPPSQHDCLLSKRRSRLIITLSVPQRMSPRHLASRWGGPYFQEVTYEGAAKVRERNRSGPSLDIF